MEVFLSTSTKIGAFAPNETIVTFRIDGGPIQERRFETTEQPALLAWATAIASEIDPGGSFAIYSAPNALSGPFDNRWIDAWRKNGFKTKPKAHRPHWKAFDGILAERRLKLEFVHPSIPELRAALLTPRSPPAPGTPIENPWARRDAADEMLRRALKKQDR